MLKATTKIMEARMEAMTSNITSLLSAEGSVSLM